MSKKKKNSSAADDLIESLMDDLKDIEADSSDNSGVLYMKPNPSGEEESFPGLTEEDDHASENNSASDFWERAQSAIESGASETEKSFMNEVPLSEQIFQGGGEDGSVFSGPSAGAEYQPMDEIEYQFKPEQSSLAVRTLGEDRTVSLQQESVVNTAHAMKTDVDKTLAVEGFGSGRPAGRKNHDSESKLSSNSMRSHKITGNVLTSMDASLAQAENLRLAQQRILDLENEVEHLRIENEELASAGEVVTSRLDELTQRIAKMEKEKAEMRESAQSEMLILKGILQHKDTENSKARMKIEELEARLKSDFKKIRVRERELENRLEMLRAEKTALVRSKDEYILEQKRKIDQLSHELDNYRTKCLELNKTIEANQDQVKRTERALRLALTNLEAKEENLVPLKKAE